MVTIIIRALYIGAASNLDHSNDWCIGINFKSMSYFLSNRDSEITIDPASVSARILGRLQNCKKVACISTLAILSIITNVDNTMYAMTWVFFQVPLSLGLPAGILYIRTVVWLGSIVCLF
ncbi:MAG: hypothetical protein Ct9H90mP13_10820 [Pseudomonadota bacterium]|nr:MAG: hypothetical protein Ct9H90mP13_10820 [Pseudomonadota bacterium]